MRAKTGRKRAWKEEGKRQMTREGGDSQSSVVVKVASVPKKKKNAESSDRALAAFHSSDVSPRRRRGSKTLVCFHQSKKQGSNEAARGGERGAKCPLEVEPRGKRQKKKNSKSSSVSLSLDRLGRRACSIPLLLTCARNLPEGLKSVTPR